MNQRRHRRPRRTRASIGREDAPTWEDVAREHGSFIYTVAYRLTGRRDDAEDLVQDVLVRVERGRKTYQPGSMQGWLARITTNAFLDGVRRQKRRPTDALPDDPERILPPSVAADVALAESTSRGPTAPEDSCKSSTERKSGTKVRRRRMGWPVLRYLSLL